MTPSIPDIARRVLELDGKATPGPWRGDRWDGTAKYAVLAPTDQHVTEYKPETVDRWKPVLTLDHKNGTYGFTGHKDGEADANERFVLDTRTSAPALARFALSATEREARLRALLGHALRRIRGGEENTIGCLEALIEEALAAEEKAT